MAAVPMRTVRRQVVDPSMLFTYAREGDDPNTKLLLDCGVDVNMRDFDRNCTPLHFACSVGARGVIETLVARGADLNARDTFDRTPMHILIEKRYDTLAVWMARQGGDINSPDRKGNGPVDYALPFLQRDLRMAAGEIKIDGGAVTPIGSTGATSTPTSAVILAMAAPTPSPSKPAAPPVRKEPIRVAFRSDAYKSIMVTSDQNAAQLVRDMLVKLDIDPAKRNWFDIVERKNVEERHLAPNENILEVKQKWPVKWDNTGNDESYKTHHFILCCKPNTPKAIAEEFASKT
ncbi:hypothetical protein Pelo_3328 [Pelomyxa schiedti]|nr:hypothetical protein Pelo_3328 [Pelomyxa schiedti]